MNSFQRSALIAGLGLLVMVLTAPFAEMYIMPNLIDYNDAQKTFENIQNDPSLFKLAISLYVVTFFMDIIVAWALYIFLKPVNANLSLLTAWLRLVYTVIALAGLLNLVNVLPLLGSNAYLSGFGDHLPGLVLNEVRNFAWQGSFGFFFFGIYLMFLGFLVYKANYIPRIMGILIIISGAGYFLDSTGFFFFPNIDRSLLMVTFFGELIFMLWLLIKGWRVESFEL